MEDPKINHLKKGHEKSKIKRKVVQITKKSQKIHKSTANKLNISYKNLLKINRSTKTKKDDFIATTEGSKPKKK